jgi:hypothetical protein
MSRIFASAPLSNILDTIDEKANWQAVWRAVVSRGREVTGLTMRGRRFKRISATLPLPWTRV